MLNFYCSCTALVFGVLPVKYKFFGKTIEMIYGLIHLVQSLCLLWFLRSLNTSVAALLMSLGGSKLKWCMFFANLFEISLMISYFFRFGSFGRDGCMSSRVSRLTGLLKQALDFIRRNYFLGANNPLAIRAPCRKISTLRVHSAYCLQGHDI